VDAASLIATIDAEAPPALERHGVPGIAVGVLSHGERAERTYGAASLATGEPVTTEMQFRVASITKPLVATLAMCLVEDGRLALDNPLTGLRLPWPRITLRHLLSHQAGLAGDWPKPLDGYGEGDDALGLLAADEAAPGPVGPGELFAYCNPGYWLSGAVTAKAAGATFEDALGRLVLEPLGMERSGFAAVEPVATGHVAGPNEREHRVAEPLPYPRARRPSGGLFSTVGDLLRFAGHQLGGPGPLAAASLAAMQAPQIEVDPDGEYGLGLFVWEGRGRRTIEHGGLVPGFRSHLLLVPDEATALVFLSNSDAGARVIEDLLAALGLAMRLPPEVALTEDELAAFAGTYAETLGSKVLVSVRDGGLDVSVEGSTAHLRPVAADRFVVLEGDDRADSAEFFDRGRILRYGWLYERVPG
jgi:CubicO group peptidase (beta-lactamase class C family)